MARRATKYLLAGSAALLIAGSTFVYAQGRDHGYHREGSRWGFSAEDRGAFVDARIAGVRAGLRLTPEQDKHWPAVESAVRDLVKQRSEARETMRQRWREREQGPADPVGRLREHADSMAAQAAALKRVAEASDPLYKSLDDGQKRRLAALTRGGGRWMQMRDGRVQERGWRGRDERPGRGSDDGPQRL